MRPDFGHGCWWDWLSYAADVAQVAAVEVAYKRAV